MIMKEVQAKPEVKRKTTENVTEQLLGSNVKSTTKTKIQHSQTTVQNISAKVNELKELKKEQEKLEKEKENFSIKFNRLRKEGKEYKISSNLPMWENIHKKSGNIKKKLIH